MTAPSIGHTARRATRVLDPSEVSRYSSQTVSHSNERPHRGARPAPRSPLAEKHGIDPFALFCAYYLGITAEDRYEFQNIHQVAKRFGVSAGVIKQVLSDLEMDTDRIVNSKFDMAGAQVDVMRVPEGVSRTELARAHWEAFRSAAHAPRDWKRELEDDARANEKVFGPGPRATEPSRSGAPRIDHRARSRSRG